MEHIDLVSEDPIEEISLNRLVRQGRFARIKDLHQLGSVIPIAPFPPLEMTVGIGRRCGVRTHIALRLKVRVRYGRKIDPQ